MRRNLFIIIAALAVAAAIALATRDRIPEPAATVQPVATGPSLEESASPAADSLAMGGETIDGLPTGGPTPGSTAPAGQPPAQEAGAPAGDPDAASIVRRAADAYSRVRSMKAAFVQRTENPLLGQTTTSRGIMYQRRPDRFKLSFTDPAGDVIVSDGRYFWIYYPSVDAKQVMRAPVSEAGAGAVDLQAQFLGDTDRRFTATLEGTEAVNGRSAHVVTMLPRENLGYRRLKVWIDARDHLVRRFEITENNENVRRFDLSDVQINPQLEESIFRFAMPAGARIVERG